MPDRSSGHARMRPLEVMTDRYKPPIPEAQGGRQERDNTASEAGEARHFLTKSLPDFSFPLGGDDRSKDKERIEFRENALNDTRKRGAFETAGIG
jgi:hypothetical protein